MSLFIKKIPKKSNEYKILKEIEKKDGGKCKIFFTDIFLSKPRIRDERRNMVEISPSEARFRDISYD